MVGSSSARVLHGVDRFYNPPQRRQLEQQQQKLQQQQQQQQLQQPPPPATQRPSRPRPRLASASAPPAPPAESREAVSENRNVDSDDSSSKPSVSSLSPSPSPPLVPLQPSGNLDRFLQSTTPFVPAQLLHKSARGWGNGGAAEPHPYYYLGDLWESFKEWSAYGAGVPVMLNGSDSVVQYYVPYLSAIQLYTDTSLPTSRSRRSGDENDGDSYLDTSSDGSSGSEADRIRENVTSTNVGRIGQSGLAGVVGVQTLVFEYLERDPPYGREPLADKISILAIRFPQLKTYRSCDLLPSSWMSVAWYPIYRIPTGPTLKDLGACFLTYHYLATPRNNVSAHAHAEFLGNQDVRNVKRANKALKLPLPVFGLASYKFKSSIWNSDGLQEQQLTSSLLQAADNWLRLLQVDHPDYRFFISPYNTIRR